MLESQNKNLIISYLAMRRLIGILGIALPIIVVAGGFIQDGTAIQGSISGYYYTNMHDFFIGILCGVTLFLLSYKGYKKLMISLEHERSVCFGMMIFPTSMFSGKLLK